MTMDLFGATSEARAPFRDIRSTRPGVAEEKAELCRVLNERLRRTPAFLSTASVQETRAWAAKHAELKKILSSSRSSVNQLTSAISQTEGWFK